MLKRIVLLVGLMWLPGVHAAGKLTRVDTRPSVQTAVFWEAAPGATATVLLFPGGEGAFGPMRDGRPGSQNFLVRSLPLFLAQGFNVAVIGRPSDSQDLQLSDRVSEWHVRDVRGVLDFVKQQSPLPVWLVGTSRGTLSVAAAGVHLHDPAIAGLVLTSSIVGYRKWVNVQQQNLSAIGVPVLVVHHSQDACNACPPSEAASILTGLTAAPVKKLVMVEGGGPVSGDGCGALHHHGYIGVEKEVVQRMADWMRQPAP
jgi:hypothetical protein